MNLAKFLLITIILVATGLVVLPNTVSLFAGQHYWYNLSGAGNDVPCKKCHADIAEEMKAHIGPHTGETGYVFDCELCHRAGGFNGITFASVSGSYTSVTPGVQAHAASVVRCMDCHGAYDNPNHVSYYLSIGAQTCYECHGNPGVFSKDYVIAGGFGLTSYPGDTGAYAAHLAFVREAINNSTLRGENEACIACHTAVPVKINWTHARVIEFNVTLGNPITTSTGQHNWSVTNWKSNGTAWVIVYGNTTGYGSTSLVNITWPGKVPGANYQYS